MGMFFPSIWATVPLLVKLIINEKIVHDKNMQKQSELYEENKNPHSSPLVLICRCSYFSPKCINVTPTLEVDS